MEEYKDSRKWWDADIVCEILKSLSHLDKEIPQQTVVRQFSEAGIEPKFIVNQIGILCAAAMIHIEVYFHTRFYLSIKEKGLTFLERMEDTSFADAMRAYSSIQDEDSRLTFDSACKKCGLF